MNRPGIRKEKVFNMLENFTAETHKLELKKLSKIDCSVSYAFSHLENVKNEKLNLLNTENFSYLEEDGSTIVFARIVPIERVLPFYEIIFKDIKTENELKKYLSKNGISENPTILCNGGGVPRYFMPYDKLELLKSKYEVVLNIAMIALDDHVCSIYNSLVEK